MQVSVAKRMISPQTANAVKTTHCIFEIIFHQSTLILQPKIPTKEKNYRLISNQRKESQIIMKALKIIEQKMHHILNAVKK